MLNTRYYLGSNFGNARELLGRLDRALKIVKLEEFQEHNRLKPFLLPGISSSLPDSRHPKQLEVRKIRSHPSSIEMIS